MKHQAGLMSNIERSYGKHVEYYIWGFSEETLMFFRFMRGCSPTIGKYVNDLVGGWPTSLKNWFRQLGGWHSQLNGKSWNSCSKPPTSDDMLCPVRKVWSECNLGWKQQSNARCPPVMWTLVNKNHRNSTDISTINHSEIGVICTNLAFTNWGTTSTGVLVMFVCNNISENASLSEKIEEPILDLKYIGNQKELCYLVTWI